MLRTGTDLSLRQMEMIWEIMRTGSMTKAAQSLGVSQPAISRTVRYAETRSGLRLFVKKGTRLIVTPEAEVLRREIERVFVSVDRVQRVSQSLRQGFGRPIRISSTPPLANLFLPQAISRLIENRPGLKIVAKIAGETRVEDSVATGDSDLGIVGLISQPRELAGTIICRSEAVCVLRRDDPLSAKERLTPPDLADKRLISSGRRTSMAAQMDRIFVEHGLERQIVVQTGDSVLSTQLVIEGCGIALIDPFFLVDAVPDAVVIRRFEPPIPLHPQVIYRHNRVLSRTEEALIAEMNYVGRAWQKHFEEQFRFRQRSSAA